MEEQEDGAEGSLCCVKLFEAEVVYAQIVFQFGDSVFHVRTPIVVAPYQLWGIVTIGGKDTECITWHMDQLPAHTSPALTLSLAQPCSFS